MLGRAVSEQGCYFVPLVLVWRLQRLLLILFAESLKIGLAVRIERLLTALLPGTL